MPRPAPVLTPVSVSGLDVSGTFPVAVKAGFRASRNVEIYPAPTAGSAYFSVGDTAGLVDSAGKVVWEVSGDVNIIGATAGGQVIMATSLDNVAVVDGRSGALLACSAKVSFTAEAPVFDSNGVLIVPVDGSGTTVERFDSGAGRFVRFGKLPGDWRLLASDGDRAVLGGMFFTQGPRVCTPLAFLGPPAPAASTTPTTTAPGFPSALPDSLYDTYFPGSVLAGRIYDGPVAVPPPTPPLWAGLVVVGMAAERTVVRDWYLVGGSRDQDVSGGGIAALDRSGNVVWQASGADQISAIANRVTEVVAHNDGLLVTVLDAATGKTSATTAIPVPGYPGTIELSSSPALDWLNPQNDVIAAVSPAAPAGYALLRPSDPTETAGIRADVDPASADAAVTVTLWDRSQVTYLVGQ